MNRKVGDQKLSPSPAIFMCRHQRHLVSGSGATLVLHGSSPQLRSVTDWLDANEELGEYPQINGPTSIEFCKSLVPLFQSGGEGLADLQLGFPERKILKGILAGVALLCQGIIKGTLQVNLKDYAKIYKPLRSASAQPVDESFNPLALAMINRANAYLLMRAENNGGKWTHSGQSHNVEVTEDRLISRRTMADLGNIRGKTVLELVTFLHRQKKEGFANFCSLGTTHRFAGQDDWPLKEPKWLRRLLLPWTEKQIRNQFHRLYSEGLIEARRAAGNKPWLYELPEAIGTSNSAFRSLIKNYF